MPKTILIIEDEKNFVELLTFRLQANGYKVEAAYDGEEGLAKIKKIKPDLVILDYIMPIMNGEDVCRRAKQDRATADIPVVMLTARTMQKEKIEGKKTGPDLYLEKPFEPSELLGAIKELISKR